MITLQYPVDSIYITRISQKFGENPAVYAKYGLPGHSGIDWAIPVGSPVYAAADGIISLVTVDKTGYGLHIRITHELDNGEKYITLYGHLSKTKVVFGQHVSPGELIGLSGGAKSDPNAGNSTGPHLHFGVRDLSKLDNSYHGWINPMPLFVAQPAPAPPPAPLPPSPLSTLPKQVKVVANDGLRLRASPSTLGNQIGGVAHDEIVKVLDSKVDSKGNTWYQVEKNNGRTGWICAYYVTAYVQVVKA